MSEVEMHVITVDQGLEINLVKIPSGSFVMGVAESEVGSRDNERPAHEVHVPSFYLGVCPITQKQWLGVIGKLPGIPEALRHASMPVVNVWLEDAHDFCHALSSRSGLSIRLPNEAEWEYACRAGTTAPFYWGSTITREQVNFKNDLDSGLKPAGFSGVPNAFGLFDMHGNVWEWCADGWHDDYNGAPTDGSAWISSGDGGYQVQRGGSWADPAIVCRSAFRVGDIARNTDNIVGIRICATLGNDVKQKPL